jgi:multicomponent Na+:H+ antiporter subunit D
MGDFLIVLPLLVPLGTVIGTLLLWNNRLWQRVVSVLGSSAHLVIGVALLRLVQKEGIQSVQIGNWPAPFGITLVADLLSAIMLMITGVVGLAVVLFALGDNDTRREAYGYFPLFHVLIMGVSGAFLTGDLFNLYVWFEVMLIASFVLTALGGERAQMEGALKYVTLNLISSAIFLAAIGTLYGVTGTLNMADLAIQITLVDTGLVNTLSMMFLIAFGLKAAVFPLFFWLPAAYHTPPAATSAVFAGLLSKVGVYAIVRFFTLIFVQDTNYTHNVILLISGLTMITGILGAIAQRDFRRVLSFNLISHVGFMLLGIAIFTPLALAGMILYTIHHMIVMTTLFLTSGLVFHLKKSYRLSELGGLYRSQPLIALLFLIPAISLAGMPPLSGFWPKLAILRAGLEAEKYLIVGIALMMSLLTLYSMIKIWNQAFWKPPLEASSSSHRESPPTWIFHKLPVLILVVLILGLGFAAEPIYELAQQAADQLLIPGEYFRTVLGGGI